MRHPFDGINEPQKSSRRTWLGFMGAVAGLLGLASLANAAAPPGTAVRFGPEPSPEPTPPKKPVLTNAVGEAGGGPMTKALREGGITTKAIGEEGAATKALREAATRALNEGGIRATTLAVGEEGAKKK